MSNFDRWLGLAVVSFPVVLLIAIVLSKGNLP